MKVIIPALISLGALSAGGPEKASETEGWSVAVRSVSALVPGKPATLWVGLKNRNRTDAAFCRLGLFVNYSFPDGSSVFGSPGGYEVVGSPHWAPCSEEERTLVLPGETHFVAVRVEVPAGAEALEVDAFFENVCLVSDCRVQRHSVRSEGAAGRLTMKMNLTNRGAPGLKERRPSGEPEHG